MTTKDKPFSFYDHVWAYQRCDSLSHSAGYIVWRLGTGGNAEVLHLKVYSEYRRQGHGRQLLRAMLAKLKEDPPYRTVYGFCLPDNEDAAAFYRKMGFTVSEVEGVYAVGRAAVFSATYDDLIDNHGI